MRAPLLKPFSKEARASNAAPLAGTAADRSQRIQIGLIGLASMILVVALADIVLSQADETEATVAVDTPPVLVVPDARVIGQSVDAILYTVKWDHTTRTQVREGLRMFETVNLKVTGLVLAQIDAKGMKRYGYGGEYGAYSAYGAKYYHN